MRGWAKSIREPALAALLAAVMVAVMVVLPAHAQKSGGTLKVYNNSNPPSAAIHEDTAIAVAMTFMPLYNNLVLYDQQKPRNSVETIRPELATSWAWDATRTKLTFKLRPGVTWHDGRPFTGKDVQCTFDRLRGKEPGYFRRNPRGIWYEHVTGILLDGDHEVTFVLAQPQASFLSMLASGYSPVFPCHVSGRDMRVKPIGTGPFKLVEFKSGETVKMVRNSDYWDKGLPYLDGIEYRVVSSRSTRILAFVSGEFDMTQAADITVPLLGDILKQAPKAQCGLVPTNVTTQMLINREKPPFDNPELRQAMALTLDRETFIDIVSGGKASLSVSMLPPPEGTWGMPEAELRKLPGYSTDVAGRRSEARKMMERQGYGPGNKLKVKVTTRDYNTFRDPAVLLVDQLNQIYFDAELDVIESSLWYTRLFKRDYSVALNLTGSGVDDPDAVLKMFFACKSDANYSKYCNAEVDKLLDQQSQELDFEKRRALVWDIERKLVADVARPIIFHGRQGTCWHPHVKGVVLHENSIYNGWRFDKVWLDK